MRRVLLVLLLLGTALLIGLGVRAAPANIPVAAVTPTRAIYMPLVMKPPTLTPTNTPPPTATAHPTLTPTEAPHLPGITNSGFEQGHVAWTEIPGNAIITQFGPFPPKTGQWEAWLGGETGGVDELQQRITLPANNPLWLHYWYQTDVDDYSLSSRFDVLIDAALIGAEYTIPGFGWQSRHADVSAYAGQTVTLRFRLIEGAQKVGGAAIDDVFLSSQP